jgi:tetratricopeptide (TPR) repeat protein
MARQTVLAQTEQPAQASECEQSRIAIPRIGPLISRCFSEDQLTELISVFNQRLERFRAQDQRAADALGRLIGLNRRALGQIFRIVSEREVEPEELAEKLATKLTVHRELVDRLRVRIADADADRRWPAILANIEDGRYGEAYDLAAIVKEDVMRGGAPNPENDGRNPQRGAGAELMQAQIALMQSQYVEAIRHFHAATELASGDPEMRQHYQEETARGLYLRTEDEWNEGALIEAADIYKQLLRARTRDQAPDQWAETQERLGLVLLRLGVGRRSLSLLSDAVAAFEAALEVRTKERDARAWSRAQADLASALFRLGVAKGGADELQRSVAAYRLALAELTPEAAPEEWASLQNGLGAALWTLGNRGDGAAELEAAVLAFSEALKGLNAAYHPRDWGATQNNLGAALFALAERETGVESLQRAIAAFEASLAAYRDASASYFIVGVKKNMESAETMLQARQAQTGAQ